MRGDTIFVPQVANGYAPENVVTSELGIKGSVFDRRLNFSAAVFKSKYTDVQITRQTVVGVTVASQVENAGKATINGAEFEGNLKISDNFSANAVLGYIDAKYDEFISYNVLTASYANLAGLAKFQNTPKWTNSFGLTYRGQLAGGQLVIAPTASYRSDMQMFEFAAPLLDQKAFWLYNVGASWTTPDGHIKLGVYGKNLNEEKYKIGGYNFPTLGNSVISFYGPPKTWTFSLSYKY